MAGEARAAPEAGRATQAVTVRTLFLAGVAVLGVVALALLIWHLVAEVLLVLTAIILTEGLRPAVNTLNRRMPVGLSIAAVYAALVLVILALVALLAGPVVRELSLLSSYEPVVARNVSGLLTRFQVSGQQLAGLASSFLAAAGGLTRHVESRRRCGGTGGRHAEDPLPEHHLDGRQRRTQGLHNGASPGPAKGVRREADR